MGSNVIIFLLTIFVTVPVFGDTAIAVKNYVCLKREIKHFSQRMRKIRKLLNDDDTLYEEIQRLRVEYSELNYLRENDERDRNDEALNVAVGVGLSIVWTLVFAVIVMMLYK